MANLDDLNLGACVLETLQSFMFGRDENVMSISIFMDESNTHDGTQFLTVSTAWARPKVWEKWSRDWAKKISPLKNYHAVDVHNRKEECEGWTVQARNKLVIRCLPTFQKHQIHGAVTCLDRKALDQGLAKRPGIRDIIGHDYLIAFIFAIGHAMKLTEEPLNFFHEDNDWCDRALYHFNKLKKRYDRPNATLSFGTKAAYPPLQCADVFAYEGYQQLKFDPTMVNVRRTWQAINVAKDKILVNALIADDEVTKKLCETLIDWFDKGAKGGVNSVS